MDWVEEERGYETPCWIWTKGRSSGYGFAAGARTQAHRYIWALENGPIPVGGMLHHLCRVRLCVRPDHLVLTDGREHRLTHHAGESGRRNRLSADEIHDIRTSSLSLKDIAMKYGISKPYASKVRRGQAPLGYITDTLPERPPTPQRLWNKGKTRLSSAAIRDIRSSKDALRKVAKRHGITVSYASLIRRGEVLSHL